MAVPTAFPNVDSAAEILDHRAMRRRDHLTIHVFHRFRPGERFFEVWDQPLAGHGKSVKTNAAMRMTGSMRFMA